MTTSSDQFWFREAVDGLYNRALQGMLTPGVHAGLKERGINLQQPLLPVYPARVWMDCMVFTADALFRSRPREEGLYRMGKLFSDGFASTLVGKALYSLLRVLGPRRTLPRMGRNFRSVTNYVDVTVLEHEPGCFSARFNDVGIIPGFFKGLVDASGKELGAPRAFSEIYDYDGKALTLYVDIRPKPDSVFPKPRHLRPATVAH